MKESSRNRVCFMCTEPLHRGDEVKVDKYGHHYHRKCADIGQMTRVITAGVEVTVTFVRRVQ